MTPPKAPDAPDAQAPESYTAAQLELQNILEVLQRPESSLDDLTERVKRAKYLIEWSRQRLRATEAAVDQLLED